MKLRLKELNVLIELADDRSALHYAIPHPNDIYFMTNNDNNFKTDIEFIIGKI